MSQAKTSKVRESRVSLRTLPLGAGGDAEKDIPFVLAVMSNLGGHNPDRPELVDRPLREITRENFDDEIEEYAPTLNYSVEDVISGSEGGELTVNLKFRNRKSFTPDAVAEQVPELKKIMDLRRELSQLKASLDGNPALGNALVTGMEQLIQDTENTGQTN